MVIWSGRGIFTFLVFIIFFVISIKVLPAEYISLGLAFSLVSTGFFSFYYGKKWNEEKFLYNETEDKLYRSKNNHKLFFIPMQYWGIACLIFGSLSLISIISSGIRYTNGEIAENYIDLKAIKISMWISIIILCALIAYFGNAFLKNRTEKMNNQLEAKRLEEENNRKSAQEKEREKQRIENEDPTRFMPK